MIAPQIPDNEQKRLSALHSLKILDTEPEERFDRLARMAKRMFQVPIALVSLIDTERQWFKSCFGLSISETKRDISFCAHAINGESTFIVPNAVIDERFKDNPLVTGDEHFRFYAGCPIHSPEGLKIGTLCIVDTVARIFHDEDAQMLEDFARMVEAELAAKTMATMDELTGISNRRGFYLIAEHSVELSIRHKSPATVAVFDLNNFKQINDEYGHAEGDDVLVFFANELKRFFRSSDLVARLGGDEFAVLLVNTPQDVVGDIVIRLKQSISAYNLSADHEYNVGFSVGIAQFESDNPKTIHALVELADEAMFEHKRTSQQARSSG